VPHRHSRLSECSRPCRSSDEIMVFPSTLLTTAEDDAPTPLASRYPITTEGLRFICRESVDQGRSHFDHRWARATKRWMRSYSMMMSSAWENVFLSRCGTLQQATPAPAPVAHMRTQVVVKNNRQGRVHAGSGRLAGGCDCAEASSTSRKSSPKLWVGLEPWRACLRAAEADAALDMRGVMRPAWNPLDAARNFFPRLYPPHGRDYPADLAPRDWWRCLLNRISRARWRRRDTPLLPVGPCRGGG